MDKHECEAIFKEIRKDILGKREYKKDETFRCPKCGYPIVLINGRLLRICETQLKELFETHDVVKHAPGQQTLMTTTQVPMLKGLGTLEVHVLKCEQARQPSTEEADEQ